jgi:hypothetical protein
MLRRVNRWLLLVAAHGDNPSLQEDWESISNPGSDYKFVLRHALHLYGQAELADFDRRRFQALT